MSPAILDDLASRLVGPHFGILEQIQRVQPEPDDPPLAVYAGRLANTQAFAELAAPRVVSGAAWNAGKRRWPAWAKEWNDTPPAYPRPAPSFTAVPMNCPARPLLQLNLPYFAPKQYRQRRTISPFTRYSTTTPSVGRRQQIYPTADRPGCRRSLCGCPMQWPQAKQILLLAYRQGWPARAIGLRPCSRDSAK